MISCFKSGQIVTSDVEVLSVIERILDLHAFETADLIHQYYLERLGHQKDVSKSEYGKLTIRANFIDSGLVVCNIQIKKKYNYLTFDLSPSLRPIIIIRQ